MFLTDLCDIAISPSQSVEYVKQLKNVYQNIGDHSVPEHFAVEQNAITLNDWKHKSEVMMSFVKQKMKLEGVKRG